MSKEAIFPPFSPEERRMLARLTVAQLDDLIERQKKAIEETTRTEYEQALIEQLAGLDDKEQE